MSLINPCSGCYTTVQDEGVALPKERILDFAGAGVTATDDAANSRTLVTIPSGGGGSDIGARVYNSTDQSTTNNTNFTLLFDSERFDTDGIHSNTVNPERLTCQTAGKYLIWGSVYFDFNATGYRFAGFVVNPGGSPGAFVDVIYCTPTQVTVGTCVSLSTVYALSVGDEVEFWVKQTSGGALLARALPQYSPEFGMSKIG